MLQHTVFLWWLFVIYLSLCGNSLIYSIQRAVGALSGLKIWWPLPQTTALNFLQVAGLSFFLKGNNPTLKVKFVFKAVVSLTTSFSSFSVDTMSWLTVGCINHCGLLQKIFCGGDCRMQETKWPLWVTALSTSDFLPNHSECPKIH